MARLAFFLALFVYAFTTLCSASPILGARENALLPRWPLAPEPKNGTIELHHNADTSSWYLLVALNPTNYTDTSGNKTINGTHNPLLTVTLFFNVSSKVNTGNVNETDYTVYSTPVAFEHHINDNLTSVSIFNAAPQFYPEGQEIFFDLALNGVPVPQVAGGPTSVNGTGFTADLNKPLNITGIFTIHF
ncbi:hypothetical protein DACRYDRAFT_19307 [Dacryopinax primogenitus]|uniref:Uncharacterized protein n=1 Tax=Dacryopinax primogenitus (strain DJM 731) TaxID=1858805 RepID=M5GGR5_DACPD|nr:uncharacterized protein DACRYDRAFT_19307 [Dacryopinax primogenitus]EJU05948.1 hypothetical protein DACRYDRAFT_19307 [Dacryopinax primogenitus]